MRIGSCNKFPRLLQLGRSKSSRSPGSKSTPIPEVSQNEEAEAIHEWGMDMAGSRPLIFDPEDSAQPRMKDDERQKIAKKNRL